MNKLCNLVYFACKWTIIILGYLLVGIITVGIFSRYFLKRPLIWEYEACIALFIWCTFLGAATCFRDKQHIAFAMLANAIPGAPRRVVIAIKNILILAVLALGMYAGFLVVESTYYIEYQTLPFSLAFSYAALPVGFAASLLFVIEHIVTGGISAD